MNLFTIGYFSRQNKNQMKKEKCSLKERRIYLWYYKDCELKDFVFIEKKIVGWNYNERGGMGSLDKGIWRKDKRSNIKQ